MRAGRLDGSGHESQCRDGTFTRTNPVAAKPSLARPDSEPPHARERPRYPGVSPSPGRGIKQVRIAVSNSLGV